MNLLTLFHKAQKQELSAKEIIVERLLQHKQISTSEAVILLKTVDIKIEAAELTMSAGAKIVGGSDFERTSY